MIFYLVLTLAAVVGGGIALVTGFGIGTDFSMLMCLMFLLVAGAGRWSLDSLLTSDQRR